MSAQIARQQCRESGEQARQPLDHGPPGRVLRVDEIEVIDGKLDQPDPVTGLRRGGGVPRLCDGGTMTS